MVPLKKWIIVTCVGIFFLVILPFIWWQFVAPTLHRTGVENIDFIIMMFAPFILGLPMTIGGASEVFRGVIKNRKIRNNVPQGNITG